MIYGKSNAEDGSFLSDEAQVLHPRLKAHVKNF